MKHKKLVKKMYQEIADTYYAFRTNKDTSGWFYNEHLEMPTTLKMLGKLNKKKVLDLGCGPGLYVRELRKHGAIVKGIDNSKELIEIARKENPLNDFKIASIENRLPYKDKEFDLVLCTLVLGHFFSWDKIFKEVSRILKKNGLFVFSIKNPIIESTEKIKIKGKEFGVVKNYFKERWIIQYWDKKGKNVPIAHHHKTYSSIIKMIVNNGFEILDYEDTKPSLKSKKIFPKEYEKTINHPHFCVWKLRKK